MGLLYLLGCIIAILIIIALLFIYVIPELRSAALGTSDSYENLVQATTTTGLDWHPMLITPNEVAPTYTHEQVAQLQEWFGRD